MPFPTFFFGLGFPYKFNWDCLIVGFGQACFLKPRLVSIFFWVLWTMHWELKIVGCWCGCYHQRWPSAWIWSVSEEQTVFPPLTTCLCLSCIEWLKESLSLLGRRTPLVQMICLFCKFSFTSFFFYNLYALCSFGSCFKISFRFVILFDLLGIFGVVILLCCGL